MPWNWVLRRQWRDQEQRCARNGTRGIRKCGRPNSEDYNRDVWKLVGGRESWGCRIKRLSVPWVRAFLSTFPPLSCPTPAADLTLHVVAPVLQWSSSTSSTTGEFGPKISAVKHFFPPPGRKSCSVFPQTQLHFAMGKNLSLLEFSWEQNLIIPRLWQVLPQLSVTSPPEPTFASRKLNRRWWQKWEMGPIFMKIQMAPEEPFSFCHRFGLGNVLLLQKWMVVEIKDFENQSFGTGLGSVKNKTLALRLMC